MFQTEVEFHLPFGYVDPDGTLHRDGIMRLATAADEILPLKDARVQQNPAYLIVILLSRVLVRLGGVASITPKVVEGLYAADLAYLQRLYNEVNRLDGDQARAPVTCPRCDHMFSAEEPDMGGSLATPSIACTRR